jgi:hypothetical protein
MERNRWESIDAAGVAAAAAATAAAAAATVVGAATSRLPPRRQCHRCPRRGARRPRATEPESIVIEERIEWSADRIDRLWIDFRAVRVGGGARSLLRRSVKFCKEATELPECKGAGRPGAQVDERLHLPTTRS